MSAAGPSQASAKTRLGIPSGLLPPPCLFQKLPVRGIAIAFVGRIQCAVANTTPEPQYTMNDTPPPILPASGETIPPTVEAAPSPAATEAQPSSPGESIAAAIRKAATDAKEAAEAMLPKLKSTAERAAYGASYAASYGAVFAATLAKEVLPETVLKGLSEGAAKAAADAAVKEDGSAGVSL